LTQAGDEAALRDVILARLAVAAGVEPGQVDAGAPFSSLGLDSARLAALGAELESVVGRPIDPTVLFEFPTAAALAARLAAPEAAPAGERGAPGPGPGPGEPVAIVGIGCRLPGADGPDAFWQLLAAGVDAVTEVPAGRWDVAATYDPDPAAPGRSVSRWGGFLADPAEFDARFFRISAEEALRMDPQQRLLLEVCWEAMEDAGEVPARLRGSRTGVYVGISVDDYAHRQLADRQTIGPYVPTGNSLAVAANRLSYVFDLRGPSLAVDTACSSSLVAVHLACRALRAGECERAVAGGVNLVLDPEISVGLSKAGMLAPDGRCRAFDARAAGYVRGEGCALVVLRPLRAALAAGDRVYAVIRGSAVNQDGASNGLTAPNPAAQRAVLVDAYRDAAVDPAAVGYVECHGTGTLLGDPIEARSLGAVVGAGRLAGEPCLIGSVKTNIGHLEAAAGIAGLVKVALALHRERLPGSLHFVEPNPHIPFAELGLAVATATRAWPTGGAPRLAGVSGFGFGGTNAHVVVAEAPAAPPAPAAGGPLALAVSARSAAGLERLLLSWADRLEGAGPTAVAALAHTANTRRTHHRPYRAALVAPEPAGLAERARAAAGSPSARPTGAAAPRVGFVFSGQGSQWRGMAAGLLRTSALFRSAIRRCDEAADGALDWSIEDVLAGRDGRDLDDTAVAQPVLVAVQVGVAAVWRALGIEPAGLAGHSVGEVSAAIVAGALDLPAGMRLAISRGRAMASPAGRGRMLAVALARPEAWSLAGAAPGVSVAAVNGPEATVLAGDPDSLEAVRERLTAAGTLARWLDVRYAFHSPSMEPAAAALVTELAGLACGEARVPLYSTILGRRVRDGELDAAHWGRGVREPVDLAAAVTAMLGDGVDALLEVGPRTVLQGPLRALAQDGVAVLASLRDDRDDRLSLLESAGRLYALGSAIGWHALTPAGPVASVPAHPWDHERFWLERQQPRLEPGADPLLGARLDLAPVGGRSAWEVALGEHDLPELRDHVVGGTAVLPGAAFVDLAVRAARALAIAGPLRVDGLRLHQPVPLVAGVKIQTSLTAGEDGVHGFTVHGRAPGEDAWRLHASALVVAAGDEAPVAPGLAGAATRCLEAVDARGLYALLAANGLVYGPAFRGVRDAWRGPGEATGWIALEGGGEATADLRALDAALHLIAAAAGPGAAAGPVVPVAAEQVWWWSAPAVCHRAHVAVRETAGGLLADVTMLDRDDRPSVAIRGLELRGATPPARPAGRLHVYEPTWRERPLDGAAPAGRWLILTGGASSEIARGLAARGVATLVCRAGTGFAVGDGEAAINPGEPEHYRRLLTGAGPLAGVVHLWGLDAGDGPTFSVATLLYLVQAISHAPVGPRLVVATRGTQPVAGGVADPHAGTVWGLLKTLPLENSLLDFVAVDLDPDGGDAAAALAVEMAARGPDVEVAYRGGRRFVRRLVETGTAGGPPPGAPLHGQGTYVITGGTGGLGRALARRLTERGATHVALIARGRRPAAAGRLVVADVAVRDELAGALAEIRSWGAPIRGVVHAAGVLDDRALLDMPADSLDRVLRPKVAGAWNLHELTADDPLDWFVLFSSAAGILGSPGQANYAAANAYLDALAHRRRALGLPGLAIDWGPWADAGMAAESPEGQRLRTAVSAIAPGDGLAALEALIESGRAQAVVLPFDLRDLLQFYPTPSGLSFFDEVASEDVRALKTIGVPPSVRPELGDEYVAPRGETERRIAAIWQRSLGIEPIGVLDRFFELGGDSVFANQILLEVNRALGVIIDPRAAFEDFTIANLAAIAEAAASPAPAAAIQPGPATGSAPASLFQEEVWASQRGVPSTAPFTISFAAFVDAELDSAALARAVEGVARRHQALRTTFAEEGGELRQRVSPDASPLFSYRDLSALPAAEADAAAVAAATELARAQLDLARGPLAAVTLARVRPGRHLLAVLAHHLVADGWSLNVALGELSALYDGFVTGVSPALPDLPIQYADFAVWQREWLERGDWRPHLEHWRSALAGLSAPRFPSAPSGGRSPAAGQVPIRLSAELSAALRRLVRAEDVTVFMALQAALAILVHEETGSTDVPIGAPTAGRRRPETHPLIGLFTSYVVLRTDLAGDPPFRDLLRHVRETCLAAYANDQVDTALYLREVEPGRAEPLYRSTLVLQPRRRVLTFAGAALDAFQLDPGQGLSDLSLYAWDEEPSIWGRLKYLEDVYGATDGERLAARLLDLLAAAAADPSRRLSALRGAG
jgi:acyl transferase domain-containing protein/acyl carrier protein